MTDHKALAEDIKRRREINANPKATIAEQVFALRLWQEARDDTVQRETAYLELWARVQALELAIATHGAEACGILRAYHEEDGRRLWLALRAALQPPETDQ